MKRIRIIAAVVTVASLAYIVLYWMVLADWAAMHFRTFPAALHSLVAWPAFCYSSALLVGSLFNNVGGEQARRSSREGGQHRGACGACSHVGNGVAVSLVDDKWAVSGAHDLHGRLHDPLGRHVARCRHGVRALVRVRRFPPGCHRWRGDAEDPSAAVDTDRGVSVHSPCRKVARNF